MHTPKSLTLVFEYLVRLITDNSVDEFALKLVKDNETVGHLPREYSRILWYYIARGGKDTRDSDWLQTFICSSKAKIDRLKELLNSKIRW